MNKIAIILLAILTLSTGLTSCVSTSVPKKEKRAKKKLSKHLKGLKNITKEYPQLVDTFTLVIHDTITIDSHTVDTSFVPVTDTAAIDKLLMEFLSEDKTDTITLPGKIRYLREQIIKEVLKDTTFFYQDSIIASTLILRGGKFYTSTVVKQKEIPYIKTTTTQLDFDCETTKPPYKYWWFWLMLLIIFFLLYITVKK